MTDQSKFRALVSGAHGRNFAESTEFHDRFLPMLRALSRMMVGSNTPMNPIVHCPDGFSYDNWRAGLKAGRSFVTTGPMCQADIHVLVSGEWQCRGKRMACTLAIRGLHAESSCDSEHALLHHWIELIHGYVTNFVRPRCGDELIPRAWKTIAMMSAEHFRRLCLKNLGHSPMMHFYRLRVERAGELLRATDLKIETICEDVGYEYRSTFSNVFTKFMGMRPSAYRETATGAARR